MKKIHLIESIASFLASDNAGDSKGIYHPEEIKVHLNNVFNKAVYDSWLNGKRYSDFSQLDAWSKTYEVAVASQIGAKAHGFLPFAPIQLPDAMGLRMISDHADVSTVFAPMESTASVVFAELEVSTMDMTPTFSLEQNNLSTGAGESSHMLRFDKLPVAPATLITSVNVLLIQSLENMDDYDDVVMPSGMEDNIIQQVIALMSKKGVPDVSNDMVITK